MMILFCVSLAVVAYVYFGYPLLLRAGAFGRPRAFERAPMTPYISVIVAAHNEEFVIEAKIRNLFSSDYPRDRVEILIGSDGSSDATEEIVRRLACEGMTLISFPQQHGKSAIQNALVASSSGELLVFTDADCLFAPSALHCLAEHFADRRVGLVTACPRYVNSDETAVTENESLYLRYETWLRRQESARGLLAAASGSLFAMRRSLWQPLDPSCGDDFFLPLRVARAGFVNRADPRVRATTHLGQIHPRALLRMKIRVISKDLRALVLHRDLLNPWRHRALAVGLWSHKLLRWLVPFFLLLLLASSVALAAKPVVFAALVFQAVFYVMALAGFVGQKSNRRFFWTVPMSFCLVNLAALAGVCKCLLGARSGSWKPERRSSAPAPSSASARSPRVLE